MTDHATDGDSQDVVVPGKWFRAIKTILPLVAFTAAAAGWAHSAWAKLDKIEGHERRLANIERMIYKICVTNAKTPEALLDCRIEP